MSHAFFMPECERKTIWKQPENPTKSREQMPKSLRAGKILNIINMKHYLFVILVIFTLVSCTDTPPQIKGSDCLIYAVLSETDKTAYLVGINSINYVGDIIIGSEAIIENKKYKVVSIGINAFYNCRGIRSVKIPNTITKISAYAFRYCNSLKSISLPNSITMIESGAFASSGIDSIIIPNSVKLIGGIAFEYCHNLSKITMSTAITEIYSGTFYSCDKLSSFTIPDGVNGIGASAFYGCSSLKSINIPSTVKKIGNSAFYYCAQLTSITIPNSVISIDEFAFSYCSSIESVTVKAITPPLLYGFGSNIFYSEVNNTYNKPLYVPKESIELYKSANGWKLFSNISAIQ